MNILLDSYREFLIEAGAGDQSGKLMVKMGGGVAAPPKAAVASLTTKLRRGLGRTRWFIRLEVGLIVVLFVFLLALIALAAFDRVTVLTALGVDIAAVMGVLYHLHALWRDQTEIELVIAMADNLPPADLLRFIEMRREKGAKA